MAYQELIKNFERIREYMRQFYIYGFKSRMEYEQKSGRTYDNERRRIEGYLAEDIAFHQTAAGKQVFLSIDSRTIDHNPFYKAFKAKSFTNADVTLHFYLLDLLHDPSKEVSVQEAVEALDGYLSWFKEPMLLDASTIRKKLKEYEQLGLCNSRKQGKQVLYRRSEDVSLTPLQDMIAFYAEMDMLGVIGSYLLDRTASTSIFTFKHHYLTHVLESEVLCDLLQAMQEQREVLLVHVGRNQPQEQKFLCVPLKIYVSTQHGRQYLLAYHCGMKNIKAYRLDYIKTVKPMHHRSDFAYLQGLLAGMQEHMWGIRCHLYQKKLEHVAFTITFQPEEEYIYQRLVRERRCGKVERIDVTSARFTADVYDTGEMIPWIRTFTGRILQLNFSNRTIERQLKDDLEAMYQLYEMGGI